jgi:sugar phosphate isomerase/epimerase
VILNLALSTMWWGEGTDAVEQLVGRTLALGLAAVELDYRRPPQTLELLREAMSKAGLRASSVHAPFPCPPGAAPLQQADLAADDTDAHRHAEALVAGTLDEAASWGVGVVVLHAGNVPALASLEARLKGLFGRGQAEEREFARLREELRKRRAQEAPRRMERVRQALGRLVPRAQELGILIALETRADYRDLPSLAEVGQLLEEFWPAVGYWHDLGHAFRQDALGFCPQEEWLACYGERTLGLHLHDAIGLSDHRPPGRGELPWERLVPLMPAQSRRVLEVESTHSDEEVKAGLAYLQALGVLA